MDALFLDPGGASPLHRQLYVALRARILGGELEPGEQLPPTRSLARTLSLSRATVTEAYEQLRAEGYVKGRAGAGTYVASNIAPISMPPGSKARPGLSTWGRNVATFSTDPDHALDPTVCFDLRPHGVAGDVFPWDEWQAAVDAVLRYDRDTLLRYPPAAGLPDLQRVIAAHVRRYRAVQCVAEQVIVVNGAQQGLNLLAATLLAPGDHVAVENPGYPAASRALRALDLQVNRVPVDRDGLIVEALRACGPQKLIHVTPSHQDPTGVTMALSRRLALLEVARDFGSVVVEDDYDSEFRYEGSPIESLQSLDRGGHTVYMGSFSKSVLPGLRIGYMVVPPPLVAVMRAAKGMWDSGASALDQAALARFIETGAYERHIRRMRRVYRARRDAMITALDAEFGDTISIGERHGGLNVLVRFHEGREDAIIAQALTAGVALRSVREYFTATPADPTFLIGFGIVTPELAPAAVRALRTVFSGPAV